MGKYLMDSNIISSYFAEVLQEASMQFIAYCNSKPLTYQ